MIREAAKKKKRSLARQMALGALLGGGVRGLGEMLASPIVYSGLRHKGVPRKAALIEIGHRIPQAALAGAPLGALILGIKAKLFRGREQEKTANAWKGPAFERITPGSAVSKAMRKELVQAGVEMAPKAGILKRLVHEVRSAAKRRKKPEWAPIESPAVSKPRSVPPSHFSFGPMSDIPGLAEQGTRGAGRSFFSGLFRGKSSTAAAVPARPLLRGLMGKSKAPNPAEMPPVYALTGRMG